MGPTQKTQRPPKVIKSPKQTSKQTPKPKERPGRGERGPRTGGRGS